MARSDAGGYYEMGGERPRIRVQVISRWRKFPDIFFCVAPVVRDSVACRESPDIGARADVRRMSLTVI